MSPSELSAAPDPNWLLSSVAQSAAAMVAIIGGLLVTRLVNLGQERAAVEQQLEDLSARRAVVQSQFDDNYEERLDYSIDVFEENHLADVVAARGAVDPTSLMSWIPVGSNEAEMLPIASRLVTSVQEAFTAIQTAYSAPSNDSFGHGPDVEGLRADGVQVPRHQEHVYEEVASFIQRSSTKRTGWPLGPEYITAAIAPNNWATTRQDARIARERDLGGKLREIDAAHELLRKRQALFGRPQGLRQTMLTLAYLALVGIVLPLALMAWRPVAEAPAVRILVVALFVSGLGLLFWEFISRARRVGHGI